MKKTLLIFLVIEAILYLTFLTVDVFMPGSPISDALKFTSMGLCFLLSFYLAWRTKWSEDRLWITSGILLSLIADIFLLLLSLPVPGIIIFCATQLIYLSWLCSLSCRLPRLDEVEDRSGIKRGFWLKLLTGLLLRLFVAMLMYLLLLSSPIEEYWLYYFIFLYAISFIGNICRTSWLLRSRRPGQSPIRLPLLLIGLVLFLCCDINVLIYNISDFTGKIITPPDWLYSCSGIMMWGFYLPSQILITISSSAGVEE